MEDQNKADKNQNEPVADSDTTKPVSEQGQEQAPVEDAAKQTPTESGQAGEQQPDSSHPDEEGGGTEEKKPSRLERRIDTLVSKLKETAQPSNDQAMSEVFGNEPLVKPEDYETGLSPEDLDKRLEQRRLQDREQIKSELQAEAEYKSGINEHLADTESVKEKLGDNAELDRLVADQYEALNFLTDPRTGQTVFVPRVKMSEIYARLEKVMDKTSTAAQAEVSGKIAQQASEQAIPPSVSNQPTTSSDESEALQRAKDSGKTEDWAAVLKKRGAANIS